MRVIDERFSTFRQGLSGLVIAGLAALAGSKSLEVVNLTDTAVDDAGVAPLRALPALRRLWVHGTKVSPGASGGG